jgi:hypothetical protein
MRLRWLPSFQHPARFISVAIMALTHCFDFGDAQRRVTMRHRLAWLLLLPLLAGFVLACSDDGSIDTDAAGPTGDVINQEALLDNLEDVRALIEDNADSLDPMVVENVDYNDGRLEVALAESQNDVDVEELESICGDISSSIALPDLTVVVEKADGSESAECELNS